MIQKPSIEELKDKYRVPVAVCGAGPSLPADLMSLPTKSVGISVNHHATLIYVCEFMVFLDDPCKIETLRQRLAVYGGIKVSLLSHWSDYVVDLPLGGYWDGGFSASFATWMACYMGGDPVLLCGMDCFQGPQKHFHGNTKINVTHEYPIENHFKAWRPALEECPNSDRIKAVSGPLVEVFGKYYG